jgi:hypothetical protein
VTRRRPDILRPLRLSRWPKGAKDMLIPVRRKRSAGRPAEGDEADRESVGRAKTTETHFLEDPNRLAAAIAGDSIENFNREWGTPGSSACDGLDPTWWAARNPKRPPHKVISEAGGSITLHIWAAKDAVEFVNKSLATHPRKANKEAVLRLLRLGRTSWPPDGILR